MKQLALIVGAFAAGLAGGILGARINSAGEQDVKRVVRAQSFELVDDKANVISFWGVDELQQVVLAFGKRPGTAVAAGATPPGNFPSGLRNPANQLTVIGLLGDDGPYLAMRGPDGKTRVRMYLSQWAQPLLLMEDATGPRLSLGIDQSDTPGPQDLNWGLIFSQETARIGVGIEKVGGQKYLRGVFHINPQRVEDP